MARSPSATASSEANKVKAANAAYYQALSARDIRAMEKVWTCAANDILVAPPINPVTHVGWEAIKQNWESYWPTFTRFSVSMVVTMVNVNGPVAWVHGIETSHRRTKSGEVTQSRNYGTNIFVNRNGSWLLEFHQAALIPEGHNTSRSRVGSTRHPDRRRQRALARLQGGPAWRSRTGARKNAAGGPHCVPVGRRTHPRHPGTGRYCR